MSAVSSWLLSITGIMLLSVLTEFVLPEGQMNKYIKTIFSFAILLVIILPIPQIFEKKFDLSDFFGKTESSLQDDYLYQINIDKLTALNADLSKKIEKNGIKNVEISINANVLCENLEIYDVCINLCNAEYDEKFDDKDNTKIKLKIIDWVHEISILKNVEVKFDE